MDDVETYKWNAQSSRYHAELEALMVLAGEKDQLPQLLEVLQGNREAEAHEKQLDPTIQEALQRIPEEELGTAGWEDIESPSMQPFNVHDGPFVRFWQVYPDY